jgi:hypothetical protein
MTGLMTKEQSADVNARFDALTPEEQRDVLTDEVGQIAAACYGSGIEEGLVHDIVNQYYSNCKAFDGRPGQPPRDGG